MPKTKLKLSRKLGSVGRLFSIIPDTTAIINKTIDNSRPIIEKHMDQRHEKQMSLIKIDNVVNLPLEEAKEHLERQGFVVSAILAKPSKKLAQVHLNEVVQMIPKSGKHLKGSLVKLYYVDLDVINASQELIDEETRRIVERNQTISDSFESVKNVIPFRHKKK
ncbi:PASTA domain-containing protein [Streptococcus hyovaginalis]|uniref:PASTA domain-containing protein n=1 Tax=Streptococcus hyovaginalis TaxID=149015 RepID=UPI00041F6055|nr:PASTA domain-containing protein [Streptococcus hyovaginalis]